MMPFDTDFQAAGPHGYRYTLREPDGETTWSAHGYATFEAAAKVFTNEVVPWAQEKMAEMPPRKWWQFWKPEIEPPSVAKHVY